MLCRRDEYLLGKIFFFSYLVGQHAGADRWGGADGAYGAHGAHGAYRGKKKFSTNFS